MDLYIVRVLGYDGNMFYPTNLYYTTNAFYIQFVKGATYNYEEGIEYLIDTIVDGVDEGILILNGDEAYYRSRNKQANIPVKVHTSIVSFFNEKNLYARHDVVLKDDRIYFRKEAGIGPWTTDDWTEIISGHLLTSLTHYLTRSFNANPVTINEGAFFYGDKLRYTGTPFKPDEESEIEFIRDINNDKFDFFYEGFRLHENTIFHSNL